MLNKNEILMIANMQSMLDEIHTDTKAVLGYSQKSDGSITLLLNYGTSSHRLNPPLMQVEVISFSLNENKQVLFLFESVLEAYEKIEIWYARKKSSSENV